jgi:tetratricopeptide (TPR) repeat protein
MQADPLERIVRTFDAVAFRQAALVLDQMEASRLAALSPHQRALNLAGQAKDYLGRGLLLEAERLYQSAVAADGAVADAHAGLAEVRERTGDAPAARREAEAALGLQPSAEAYLVLGWLDLASNHLDEARNEAAKALQFDPKSRAAQDLNRQIESKTVKTQ